MLIFADVMDKVRIYLLALCAAVALGSCDFLERNKPLVREIGKAVASEIERNKPSAGSPHAASAATEADDALLRQASPEGMPEQMLRRTGYTASYNKATKLPNWVAWHLTADRTTGPAKRSGVDFEADTDVPESFLFTSMCPQDGNLNRGDWNEMEQACRRWAKEYGGVYIVCGPILYKGKHKTIGRNKVTVPEAFFKVVLRMGENPKAIGFIYKNTGGNRPKGDYVNTVDEVERLTGIDFFPALPDDVEKRVEAEADIADW